MIGKTESWISSALKVKEQFVNQSSQMSADGSSVDAKLYRLVSSWCVFHKNNTEAAENPLFFFFC